MNVGKHQALAIAVALAMLAGVVALALAVDPVANGRDRANGSGSTADGDAREGRAWEGSGHDCGAGCCDCGQHPPCSESDPTQEGTCPLPHGLEGPGTAISALASI